MNFQKICIIGTGLIGSSLALAFRRHQIGEFIWGVDKSEIIDSLEKSNIVDQVAPLTELVHIIPQADLIILAAPIKHILNLIPRISEMAAPGTLVTDVGSTKQQIVRVARMFFHSGVTFLGGHPMAGSERSGHLAADPFMFENCYYVLTPTIDTPLDVVNSFSNIIEKIGAKVLLLDAAVHDRIAASVSHLPQILAVSLVNLLRTYQQKNPYYLKMAAGGFRDMTRIASSPFSIWEDICESNKSNISQLIDKFIAELEMMKQYFKDDHVPVDMLGNYFEAAARTRLSIPHDTKGFLKPLFDLTVVVRDEPGVIAKISSICYDKGINIRDIEVLKVRLWEGGTIRLAFETEPDRLNARRLLESLDFECHIRK